MNARWLSLVLLPMLVGCSGQGMFDGGPRLWGSGGALTIRSQDPAGAKLSGGFERGLYSFDDKNNLTVVLFDGPEENPRQAVTIRLLWTPRAGRTPIDPNATNATIHYVIFTGQDGAEVGVYQGAGYLFPRNKPGSGRLDAGLWDANLRLADRSDRFNDLLGQASIKGGFQAKRDELALNRTVRQLNVMIGQRLGYPRLVCAD